MKAEIAKLDEKDDAGELSEADAVRRREAHSQLFSQLTNWRSLLSQKARFRWILEGDINSKIFHRSINYRRQTNGILGLEIEDEWNEDPNKVKPTIRDYFKKLFTGLDSRLVELPADLFENRLEATDGAALTAHFTKEEIKSAVWDCDESKSPGPDIFGMEFYKSCWDIIKDDILRSFGEFHSNGKLVKGSNPSYIALISKKEGICNLHQFC